MTSGLGDANLERIKNRSALGRFAAVDEVAAGVGYLLSNAAAGHRHYPDCRTALDA